QFGPPGSRARLGAALSEHLAELAKRLEMSSQELDAGAAVELLDRIARASSEGELGFAELRRAARELEGLLGKLTERLKEGTGEKTKPDDPAASVLEALREAVALLMSPLAAGGAVRTITLSGIAPKLRP